MGTSTTFCARPHGSFGFQGQKTFLSGNNYAVLGEKDSAFEWLAKAYEEDAPGLLDLDLDPDYDSLRIAEWPQVDAVSRYRLGLLAGRASLETANWEEGERHLRVVPILQRDWQDPLY